MPTQCKRCGSGMADTAETCPVCKASVNDDTPSEAPTAQNMPLAGIPGLPAPTAEPVPNYMNQGAAPMGAAPMGGGSMGAGPAGTGGEIRVSLTGDVFEVPPPTPRAAGPGGRAPIGGSARPGAPPLPVRGHGRGPAPAPATSARPRYGMPSASSEAKSGGVPIWAVALALLVLCGGGFGAFYWLNHRTDPKVETLAAYKSLIALDFRALYPRVAMSPENKSKYPNADAFAKDMQTKLSGTIQGAMIRTMAKKLKNPQVGEPTINGNNADVPTSIELSLGGKSFPLKGTAHLVREWGVWKLDATTGDLDAQKAQELIGKPDMAALGAAGVNLSGLSGLLGQ